MDLPGPNLSGGVDVGFGSNLCGVDVVSIWKIILDFSLNFFTDSISFWTTSGTM